MAPPDIGCWPTAAYLYLLTLDRADLGWEYLRRNETYRQDWQTPAEAREAPAARRWGLRQFENPHRDARDARPQWLTRPESVLRLVPEHDDESAEPFRVWHLPGHKRGTYDGERLHLTCSDGRQQLRLQLDDGLEEGRAFALALRAVPRGSRDPLLQDRLRRCEFRGMSDGAPLDDSVRRESLMHFHALQALDASAAGATHREIATALFSETDVIHRWTPDGDLRARIKRLLQRGQAFCDGDYRRLVQGPGAV